MTDKTKIKIGGVSYKLEDMPESFQDAVKKSMEGINNSKNKVGSDNKKSMEGNRKDKIGNDIGIVRKMFGYRKIFGHK
jgi:hypothetical protein